MARPKTVPKSRQPQAIPNPLPINKTSTGGGDVIVHGAYMYAAPQWATAEGWRRFVREQPVMITCRDVLIQQLVALPWLIVARDSERADELRDEIEYHTDVLRKWGGEDYDTGLERFAQDMLTLPFGGCVESGFFRDGTIAWVESMDGATLYPTRDPEYPVAQRVAHAYTGQDIAYPRETVHRAYISARPEFERKGWGMAPPEKVYLSASMLAQGDKFYWSMLIDTPEHGIIDLADTSQQSALAWLDKYRALLQGVDPQKLIVTWEHEKPINYIPLKRSPVDIELENAKSWYATLCAAGYGVPLSEIGLSVNSTLAGAIRDDRRGRRNGFGYILTKVENAINDLIPEYLKFQYENRDDEALGLLGRARVASVTAFSKAIADGVLAPEGVTAQLRADGLISEVALKGLAEHLARKREMADNLLEAGKTTQVHEQNDDRRQPPDVGGLSDIKQQVDRALRVLLPDYQRVVRSTNESWTLDYHDKVVADILMSDESHFVRRSREERVSLIALATASAALAAPWARKSILRSHTAADLRGTGVYHRIFKELEGIYAHRQ